MRPSLKKHVLPILREIIGLRQEGFAELIGCSLPTIQSVESGRLQLSQKLAEKIAFETGVQKEWLLTNDPSAVPVDSLNFPYTKATFDNVRAYYAKSKSGMNGMQHVCISYETSALRMAALLVKALEKDQFDLFAFRLTQALDELLAEVGLQPKDVFKTIKEFYPKTDGELVLTAPNIWNAYEIKVANVLHQNKSKTADAQTTTYDTLVMLPDGRMVPADLKSELDKSMQTLSDTIKVLHSKSAKTVKKKNSAKE